LFGDLKWFYPGAKSLVLCDCIFIVLGHYNQQNWPGGLQGIWNWSETQTVACYIELIKSLLLS